MTDAPEAIYLQWIPGYPNLEGDAVFDEVTWCFHEVDEDDVEYIRADAVAAKDARIKELETTLKWGKFTATYFKDRVAELEAENDQLVVLGDELVKSTQKKRWSP